MSTHNSQLTADDIAQQMEFVRQRLDADVDSVRSSVEEMTDWRQIIRKHPLATIAAASALGYLLVPNRRFEHVVDAKTLQNMTGDKRIVLAPSGTVTEQASMSNKLLAVAGAGLLRLAGGYLTAKLSEKSNPSSRKDF